MRSFAPPSLLFWAQCMCLVFVACMFSVEAQAPSTDCGQVFDGLTRGKFDLDIQFSTSTLAANWAGFAAPVLSYEWAIFSDAALPAGTDFSLCRNQLRSLPDVQTWRSTRKELQAVNNQLALVPEKTYYSAVRATLRTGEHVIAFSNGVKVVNRPHTSPEASAQLRDAPQLAPRALPGTTCPIDDNNRCRSSQVSVADRLSKLYGPARYPDEVFFPGPRGDDDDGNGDDDDEGGAGDYPWIIAPIIGGLLLLICLILLCLVLLALLAKGSLPERAPREKKPKKEKETPMSFVEADEQKNYGMRDNVDAMDATTATVVEFPDTQIRRLSISHKDESMTDVAGPKRGRAPHPIMDSASSSFRDYRNH